MANLRTCIRWEKIEPIWRAEKKKRRRKKRKKIESGEKRSKKAGLRWEKAETLRQSWKKSNIGNSKVENNKAWVQKIKKRSNKGKKTCIFIIAHIFIINSFFDVIKNIIYLQVSILDCLFLGLLLFFQSLIFLLRIFCIVFIIFGFNHSFFNVLIVISVQTWIFLTKFFLQVIFGEKNFVFENPSQPNISFNK